MSRFRQTIVALVALGALAAPTATQASPSQVISDCADDGSLSRQYSREDLQGAQSGLPTDLAEYTDCADVIAAALAALPADRRGGGSSGGGGGGGPTAAAGSEAPAKPTKARRTPRDEVKLSDLTEGAPRLSVGGRTLEPAGDGLFRVAGSSNDLPLTILLALIGVAMTAAIGGVLALRQRLPALAWLPVLSRPPTLPPPSPGRVSLRRARR
jgi:hypothetical protein